MLIFFVEKYRNDLGKERVKGALTSHRTSLGHWARYLDAVSWSWNSPGAFSKAPKQLKRVKHYLDVTQWNENDWQQRAEVDSDTPRVCCCWVGRPSWVIKSARMKTMTTSEHPNTNQETTDKSFLSSAHFSTQQEKVTDAWSCRASDNLKFFSGLIVFRKSWQETLYTNLKQKPGRICWVRGTKTNTDTLHWPAG